MFQTSPASSSNQQFNHQESNDSQPIFHKNDNKQQLAHSEKSQFIDSISSNLNTIDQNIINGSSRINQLNSPQSFLSSSCIQTGSKQMLKISSNDYYQSSPSNSVNVSSKSTYNSDFYASESTKATSPNPVSPISSSPQSIVSE